jgi:hypothetical protein
VTSAKFAKWKQTRISFRTPAPHQVQKQWQVIFQAFPPFSFSLHGRRTQTSFQPGQPPANAAYQAAKRNVTIDPITRLEGHGKIDIFLDDKGDVERAYLQVPELRGFEVFSLGRPAEDMPQITSRICGVCPTAHHMASTKALDDLYQVEPTPRAARSASWSTTPSCSRTTPCTSSCWADRTSSSAPKRRPSSATSSA